MRIWGFTSLTEGRSFVMREIFLAAVLVLVASGAQAVTLNVIGGQLMGASDVLVDGNSYDVQFLDGTCADFYSGCDDVSDFTFQTSLAAILASQALLTQVFLDGVLGNFDSTPWLTNGCEAGPSQCTVAAPYTLPSSTSVRWLGPRNLPGTASDPAAVTGTSHPSLFDSTTSPQQVWSVWTPVPEPSTALLLSLGLTGLAAQGRRRNLS
jgi:hypothetical protein